jgi:hypothetical protein
MEIHWWRQKCMVLVDGGGVGGGWQGERCYSTQQQPMATPHIEKLSSREFTGSDRVGSVEM